MEKANIIDLTGKKVTDFITEGVIIMRGEHMYLKMGNHVTNTIYTFHIPMSLFCTLIKNRIIQKDVVSWTEADTEKNEKKKIRNTGGMFR